MAEQLPSLNRHAVVVKPTAVFFEWARKTPDPQPDLALDELRREGTVYLIPEGRDDAAVERILRRHCTAIFQNELEGGCTDPAMWPQNRSYAEFKRWFDVEVHSMVLDLGGDEIEFN